MDRITQGRVGDNLLEKELLKRECEIYIPLLQNTKIDCIICKKNRSVIIYYEKIYFIQIWLKSKSKVSDMTHH